MREAWPDLWCDSQAVRRARRQTQKPREREELWAWLFLRRFSIFISIGLSRCGWITANHVTVLAVLIAAGVALWTASPASPSFIVLAVMYNVVYLLDCVDGEVARLTGKASRSGYWLDTLVGLTLLSLPLALGARILGQMAGKWAGCILLLLILNALAAIWLTLGARVALGVNVSDVSVPARKSRPILDVAILCLASDHGMFMGLPIVAAVSGERAAVAVLIWFGWHAVAAAAKNLWRFRSVIGMSRSGQAPPPE